MGTEGAVVGSPEVLGEAEKLTLADKVLSDVDGLKTLIRDTEAKLAAAVRDEAAAEADLDRLKARIVASKTSKKHWEVFLAALRGLEVRWGIEKVMVLPTLPRGPEAPDGKPAPQEMDEETRLRMDGKKLCLFKDRGTKKWCPIPLGAKAKKSGGIFCTKHEEIAHPEGRG